jgi:hypothetical protein
MACVRAAAARRRSWPWADKNPYNVGRCSWTTSLAGSRLSPAFAGAGEPGGDADRRAPTRTPYNVRPCRRTASLAGGGLSTRVRHDGTAGQPGKDADRRAPTATLYNVRRCGRAAWLAGSGLFSAFARVGQPGKDADRRGSTRTLYNVSRCGRAAWLPGGGLSSAFARAGQLGKDADRRGPTRTPYNVRRGGAVRPDGLGGRLPAVLGRHRRHRRRAASINRRHRKRTPAQPSAVGVGVPIGRRAGRWTSWMAGRALSSGCTGPMVVGEIRGSAQSSTDRTQLSATRRDRQDDADGRGGWRAQRRCRRRYPAGLNVMAAPFMQ